MFLACVDGKSIDIDQKQKILGYGNKVLSNVSYLLCPGNSNMGETAMSNKNRQKKMRRKNKNKKRSGKYPAKKRPPINGPGRVHFDPSISEAKFSGGRLRCPKNRHFVCGGDPGTVGTCKSCNEKYRIPSPSLSRYL